MPRLEELAWLWSLSKWQQERWASAPTAYIHPLGHLSPKALLVPHHYPREGHGARGEQHPRELPQCVPALPTRSGLSSCPGWAAPALCQEGPASPAHVGANLPTDPAFPHSQVPGCPPRAWNNPRGGLGLRRGCQVLPWPGTSPVCTEVLFPPLDFPPLGDSTPANPPLPYRALSRTRHAQRR